MNRKPLSLQRLHRENGVKAVHKFDVIGEVSRVIRDCCVEYRSRTIKRSNIVKKWTFLHPDHDRPMGIGSLSSNKVRRAIKVLARCAVLDRTDTHVVVRDVKKLIAFCEVSYDRPGILLDIPDDVL